jgi:hypothetical protein
VPPHYVSVGGLWPGTLLMSGEVTKTITYASGSFSIPAGKTLSVAVKLSKAGRTAVKGHHSLKAYANVTLSGGHDESAKITLKH